MAHVGLDGRCLRVNQKLCGILGYGHDEMMGLTFADMTHPDDREADLADVRRLLAGEVTAYSTQNRYARKDKSLVCIKLTVSLARTPQDQPDYFIFVVEDISERKRAEDQFRTLADSIPQLCWIADPEGYIVWYNRRWLDYTGKTLEQMWGRKWAPVLDSHVQPSVLERWLESVATGHPLEMVIPIKGRDAVYRPFLTRVEAVEDHGQRVVQWFGTNTDISELKRAEEALKRCTHAPHRSGQYLRLRVLAAPETGAICMSPRRASGFVGTSPLISWRTQTCWSALFTGRTAPVSRSRRER